MKAIRVHNYGDVDTLSYEDAPMPEFGPAEVRVRVHSAAVNPVDWKIRAGYLAEMIPYEMPLIPGWDMSGVVEQVGADVTDLSVGDEVYSRPDIARDGSYAEYMVVLASEVASKPKTLSAERQLFLPTDDSYNSPVDHRLTVDLVCGPCVWRKDGRYRSSSE